MFKIGNSKELPTIPDHLSEEGKDFVRLCLRREPLDRPSAAQLLEHPFVKSALLERHILTADPSEAPSAVINAVRSLVKTIEVCYHLYIQCLPLFNHPLHSCIILLRWCISELCGTC